mmetsp:Transcript_30494/g.55852  ORF Transcript_30494/g.55852 Transcript_30494/m.55852 type:complete len:612 (+) Transcript_30494:56-1891(+)
MPQSLQTQRLQSVGLQAHQKSPVEEVPMLSTSKFANFRLKRYRGEEPSDQRSAVSKAGTAPQTAARPRPEQDRTKTITLRVPRGVRELEVAEVPCEPQGEPRAKAKRGRPKTNGTVEASHAPARAALEHALRPEAADAVPRGSRRPTPLAARLDVLQDESWRDFPRVARARAPRMHVLPSVAASMARLDNERHDEELAEADVVDFAESRNRNLGELPEEELEVISTGWAELPWCATTHAKLLRIDFKNFRLFRDQSILLQGLEDAPHAIRMVGTNSCGKTTILDAINFVMLRPMLPGRMFLDLVRRSRGEAPCQAASVALSFHCETLGWAMLKREVIRTGESTRQIKFLVGSARRNPKSDDEPEWPPPLHEVSENCYATWIREVVCWTGRNEVILPQFSLLEEKSAPELLKLVPAVLAKIAAAGAAAEDAGQPLLKRMKRSRGLKGELSSCSSIHPAASAEAYLARRLDEIFRQLKQEPLDAEMTEWGEGGQACLRRLQNDTFTIYASQQRGYASCGYGAEYKDLADGDRDLLSLSLLLALSGLEAGQQDTLPALVILDEPDSRLDKQHAAALWRLMAGPHGPKQCVIMSLNNHGMYDQAVYLEDAVGTTE